ncbi:MAG: TonB-dependent receptor [Saprospiraceae bacterium]
MKKMIAMLALALGPFWALTGQGMLMGQVTNDRGDGLSGAHVLVEEAGKGELTDDKGMYRIEGLGAGRYTVRVTFVGYEKATRVVAVEEGAPQTLLNIQLEEQIYLLDELVVAAVRAGSRTPMTYKNLGKEELEENNMGQDVPYLLRFTPSLVETSDAGNGIGYTGLRIRGSDPTRVNITINGIPLNDPESQGVYWVNLPDFSSSVEDIQIQRGVGTSTNGAGAFGASINLNTNKVRREAYARLSGSAGSFNTWKSAVQFGSGLLADRFTLEGRLSSIQSDGYIDRARADLSSYYLSGAYVGNRSTLRFNVFSGKEETYQAWYGVSADLANDPERRTFNPAGTEKAGEPYDNEVDNYSQTHYQLLFSRQLSRAWNLNLNGHYTRGLGYYEQYKAGELLSDYGIASPFSETSDLIRRLWLDNHFYGITYALQYQRNRLNWTLGGAWNRYLGGHYGDVIWARNAGDSEIRHRFYENDAVKRDFNIFSKGEYEITDALSAYLDLQYRSIFYEFLGFDRLGRNVTQSVGLHFFNPKAGLFWSLSQRTAAYASFAVGHREPNRNDYTESSPDSRPRPERVLNTEAGLQHKWKELEFQANFYHMHYQDQLVLTGQINDVGEYTRINAPVSYRMGIELEGRWQHKSGWAAQAGATLSRNKILDFVQFVDVYDPDFNYIGQEEENLGTVDMAFSPSLIANAQLSYDVLKKKEEQSLEIALLHKYVGRQYLDNSGGAGAVLGAYFYGDLRITYSRPLKWMKRMEAALLVANIWDQLYSSNGWAYNYRFAGELYTDAGFYPQAGRNFLVSLKLDW